MALKRIFLLFLILISVSLAGPFAVELSLSGGAQHLTTNNDLFSNDPPGIIGGSNVNTFLNTSLKSGLTCYYKNTGIYISADKPLGGPRFNRYWTLSGGLKQRVIFSEISSLDFYAGTTWHSINEAIHSFTMFLIYTHFSSEPGLDIGLNYNRQITNNIFLTTGLNYNYNLHYNDSVYIDYYHKYYVQAITFNVGMVFSLF